MPGWVAAASPPGRCARFLSAPACRYQRIISPRSGRIRFRAFVSYWLTGRPGRSSLRSRFLPAHIGMRSRMAAGCGGHRMEPAAAYWTQATSMAEWWCTLLRRGPRPSSSRSNHTGRWNGSKASRRTLSSNTSLAVRCALILGSVSTRWSSPTHILRALTSRQGFSPVVCGPLPCPCRQSLEPEVRCVPRNQAPECGFLQLK
jgi:hypothetical protein